MLIYLEAARFKVQNALSELDSRPRSGHTLAPYINVTRDKSGLQQSVLKVSKTYAKILEFTKSYFQQWMVDCSNYYKDFGNLKNNLFRRFTSSELKSLISESLTTIFNICDSLLCEEK